MIHRWQRALVALTLGFGVIDYACAEISLELGPESFRWREFDAGARLLTESGTRYRLSADWRLPFGADQKNLLDVRGSLYYGNIHYDGQACTLSGSCVPFETDATYWGRQVEGIVARRFGEEQGGEIFGGGGWDAWRRDIAGSGAVAGAVEDWNVFYLSAGGGAYWGSRAARFQTRVGAKYPVATFNDPDSVDATLEPKGRVSPFARFTTDFAVGERRRFGFGVYYDSYHFGASDRVRVGSVVVFQPESRQNVLGAFGAYYF